MHIMSMKIINIKTVVNSVKQKQQMRECYAYLNTSCKALNDKVEERELSQLGYRKRKHHPIISELTDFSRFSTG